MLLAATCGALAGCASKGSSAATEREAASLARYEAAAGEPTNSFRFFRLDGFTVLGENALAVWASPRQAWLLTVEEPCTELRWSLALNITSFSGRVFTRSDSVQGCRILTIRPVDVAVLRESEKAARSEIKVQEREA
ncbi:MAG: DUF6491 family protein [Silanimonas sp.]